MKQLKPSPQIFILLLTIMLLLQSCASNAGSISSNVDRQFLDEHKLFYLTYGEDNGVDSISMDAATKYSYMSKKSGGNIDLFVIDTYSLKEYKITKNPAIDTSPSINANGKKLIFTSTRDDAFGDLYLYEFPMFSNMEDIAEQSIDNKITRITDYKGLDTDSKIARHKDLAVFVSDRWAGIPTVHTVELNRKATIKRLTDMPSKMPIFSFDDSTIAFISMESVNDSVSQLAIVDVATGQSKILTDTQTMKFNPSFYSKDVILYFEVRRDSDEDGVITYADDKRLVAYSIADDKTYTIQSPTLLTSFFTPYDSSSVGAYVDFNEEKANASIGNTKTFFIKNGSAEDMYKTFISLPYDNQRLYIQRFDEYFPNEPNNASNKSNREIVAQANFNLMISTYMRGDYAFYLQLKQKILNQYADTSIYPVVYSLEVLTGYAVDQNVERDGDRRYINNIDSSLYINVEALKSALSFLEEEDRYNTIWTRYIIASELSKYNSRLIPTYLVMENAVDVNLDSRTYVNMVKLYIKLMIDADISLIDRRFSLVYNRSDITYAEMMDIAKYTIEYAASENKLDMDLIINRLNFMNPISVAAKFSYIGSLMAIGNEAYAHELFSEYESKGNSLKACYSYAMGMIERAKGNNTAYDHLQKSIAYQSDFNDCQYGIEAKKMLAEYYLAIANEAYNNREYNFAYNNYNAVLEYGPSNVLASERRMETSLSVGISDNASSMNSINAIEKTVRNTEKTLLKTRYSDANAHLEIATSYYYLANRYYSYAIANKAGKNRYHLQNNRRQDRFSLYLLKAFDTIINKASSAIDLAIFLAPENTDYYTFKAKLLATALTMRIEITSEGSSDHQSLLDFVGLYKDDSAKTPNVDTISHYQLSADTLEYDIYAALSEAKYQMKSSLLTNSQANNIPNLVRGSNRRIRAQRVSEVLDTDPRLQNNLEYSRLSLMLANSMVINGLYIEAVAEYQNAKLYLETAGSGKENAWYNFFYAYCLWINSNTDQSIEFYKKAYEYFKDAEDIVAKFRILGYLAIADIEEEQYYEAITYLKERERLIENNGQDSSLNDLLLATCYLKNKDYNNALAYCDKVRPVIDALDPHEYNDQYLSISVFGSVVPIVNMGLAAFGGYIPDEPLNIDKKEMLYSLYQEIYEKTGDYQKARVALNEYRTSTENDKLKSSLEPIFLGMYRNNEGALYYLEGNSELAENSFEQSIEEYYRAIAAASKGKTAEEIEHNFAVNAGNDAINFINLTYLYLNNIASSQTDIATKNQAFKKLNDMLPILETLAKSPNVEKKNILLLNSNIAAINYVFARYSAEMLEPKNAIERHEQNLDRIVRIKDAISRYNYILSGSNKFEYDGATEVILRYNLGLCFDFLQNTNEAAREYTAAYEKAKANNYVLENIGILATMLDFSQKYYQYNRDLIGSPEVYAREIESLVRNNIFAFSFYSQSVVLPIMNAKNILIKYYTKNNSQAGLEKSVEVATLFDTIISRVSLLKTRRLTYNDNTTDQNLKTYYAFYEEALELNQAYVASMLEHYDAKIEAKYIAELKAVETRTTAALRNSNIKEIALGLVDKNSIRNKLATDEALIWDLSGDVRVLMNRSAISLMDGSKAPTFASNIKNITHIGFRPISDISYGDNVFYRWLLVSYQYIMPNTHTLFDTTKFAVNIVNRGGSGLFTYSASTNTNSSMSLANEYNIDNIRSNISAYTNDERYKEDDAYSNKLNDEIYSYYMNYQEISKYSNEFKSLLYTNANNNTNVNQRFFDAIYDGNLQAIERELKRESDLTYSPQTAKYTPLTNAMNLPYVPFVLDFSNTDSSLMSQYMRRSSYIAYVDRATFNSNFMNVLNVNPYVLIIGDGVAERANFYTNYINQLITNSVQNVFRGVDPKKYQIYGLGVMNPTANTNIIDNYQESLFEYYKEQSPGIDRIIAATNLINYLDSTDKKIKYYSIISEQMLLEGNTNASSTMLNMAYSLFTNSTTNDYSSENARDFMTNTILLYSKIETTGAYSNSIRLMDYMDKYLDNHQHRNTVVDEYLKNPNNIFSFLTYETNSQNVVKYFESFMPYMDEDYRYKVTLAEYATIYRHLYAGRENARNATNEMNTYILNMLDEDRAESLMLALNTLKRINANNDPNNRARQTRNQNTANINSNSNSNDNNERRNPSNQNANANVSRNTNANQNTNAPRARGQKRNVSEDDIFQTVEYIYSKPTVFYQESKIALYNHIYSIHSNEAGYMFGMLQKSVNNNADLTTLIANADKVFDVMDEGDNNAKNLFIYYTIEDKVLQAYLYGGGQKIVQKFSLVDVERIRSLVDNYKSDIVESERIKAINELRNILINRDMLRIVEQASIQNIYIAGASIVYEVPFMFFNFRSGYKNFAKVHSFAFAPDTADNTYNKDNWLNINPTASFSGNTKGDFYHELEKQSVTHSFAESSMATSRGGINHQVESATIPSFSQNNFVSPSSSSIIEAYLKSQNATGSLLFTHSNEKRGDYYTTLKAIYRNMADENMNVVAAYRKALFEDRSGLVKSEITQGDNNYRYGSFMIFDYILPYIVKEE